MYGFKFVSQVIEKLLIVVNWFQLSQEGEETKKEVVSQSQTQGPSIKPSLISVEKFIHT